MVELGRGFDMKLTPHFSLAEMTRTSTGYDNTPATREHMDNLRYTAEMMERVREVLGNRPITVTSAYRSPAVNRAVRGSTTSAHCLGFAVDFVCPSFGTPYDICKALSEAGIPFDQIIHEKRRWVHIGFGPRRRHQLLTLPPHGRRYLAGLYE